MAIETNFPDNYCKQCDECVLAVKEKDGKTIVSCKWKSICPRFKQWGNEADEEAGS